MIGIWCNISTTWTGGRNTLCIHPDLVECCVWELSNLQSTFERLNKLENNCQVNDSTWSSQMHLWLWLHVIVCRPKADCPCTIVPDELCLVERGSLLLGQQKLGIALLKLKESQKRDFWWMWIVISIQRLKGRYVFKGNCYQSLRILEVWGWAFPRICSTRDFATWCFTFQAKDKELIRPDKVISCYLSIFPGICRF